MTERKPARARAARGPGSGGGTRGGGWFEPSRPIKVEGGLRVRSRRGSIGERWWSRRFIDVLEAVCDSGRLARGRSYARSGQVLDLEIAPGRVRSRVQGSRPAPYRVVVEVEAYGADRWRELVEALSGQAIHRAALLAGEMPPEIEDVFRIAGLPLFPDETGLDMSCSCPDWGFPCKHLSAVLYVLAESFDDDPFLVLAWRGMGKESLLDALRATTLAGPGGGAGQSDGQGDGHGEPARPGLFDVADTPFAERMADFYEPSVSPARLRDRGGLPASPSDLLLRALDPPPVKARHIPLLDLLRPAYRTLAEGGPAEEDGGGPGRR
ncbi:SWIM zinc finger family protein [Microtetraspora niveoalba]|uniref:SWIM zinc finger family protein n=1 Tax=Microtetraspora niveoalba TaxID=46175 RepID=UPI0009FFE281|nr:SWIM zinc finger family protein [Microtetraspora niveoalba]